MDPLALTTFNFPTPTRYGMGALRELPADLEKRGIKRPLVVTDDGLVRTPTFQLFREVMGEEGKGWVLFSGVHPNPVEEDLNEAAVAYLNGGCDAVIALGGGSALDIGKAVRLWIKNPQTTVRTYDWTGDWSGLAPFIAIPTTAGTGSEVGRSSVVTETVSKRKMLLWHPRLMADWVVLDPQLTVGLPAHLTAATGVDALTHCIESYTCPVFHPMCDGIALEGISLVIKALPKAVQNGNDLEARGRMLVAAAMGAVAFQKDLGATHSMAHPLSTRHKMHHGLANALCLPYVMRFNSKRSPGLYRRVGIACGLDVMSCTEALADEISILYIKEFIRSLRIQFGLVSHGVPEEDLPTLAQEAFLDPCHRTNPVPVTEEEFISLYREAWLGEWD